MTCALIPPSHVPGAPAELPVVPSPWLALPLYISSPWAAVSSSRYVLSAVRTQHVDAFLWLRGSKNREMKGRHSPTPLPFKLCLLPAFPGLATMQVEQRGPCESSRSCQQGSCLALTAICLAIFSLANLSSSAPSRLNPDHNSVSVMLFPLFYINKLPFSIAFSCPRLLFKAIPSPSRALHTCDSNSDAIPTVVHACTKINEK